MTRTLLGVLMAAGIGLAQPPISNAKFQTASAAGGLEAAIQSAIRANGNAPLWIGYAVPAAEEHNSCCWSGWSNGRANGPGGCGLEGQRVVNAPAAANSPVKLEAGAYHAILLRADQGAVMKVNGYSLNCPLDAGGLPLVWLNDARPAESIAMLSKRVAQAAQETTSAKGKNKIADGAIALIAMHKAPEADRALEGFLNASQTEGVRKQALFWLGNSRGRRGFELVSQAARNDPNDKVREHAIFALTQSKEPQAAQEIIRIAKEDRSTHVRGQALFWLSQMASRQSAQAITEAVENDPDTEVKKKAVFALSQLKDGTGVPKLIEVAQRNTNPAVRKQAIFWLGQSKDQRALKFLEDVLTK